MSRKHVEINPECGRRLKDLLVRNEVSQRSLAEKLDYEPQHISNVVRGLRRLTPDMACNIKKIFPAVRVEWLLCQDDYETQEKKDLAAKEAWKESERLDVFYEQNFKCFIDSIEALSGYGLHSQGTDILLGEYITVSDETGRSVGCVSVESLSKLREELEHYASYLVNLLIKSEMMPLPTSKTEVNGNG